MNRFKIRLALLTFLTTMFVRLGIILFIGIALFIIGARINVCRIIGAALIMFVPIVSLIQSIRTFTVMKNSDHPFMKEINKAMNSNDPYGNIGKVVDEHSIPDENIAGSRIAPYFIKSTLSRFATIEECIDYFERTWEEKIPGEEFIFQYGVTAKPSEFILCFTRQFPSADSKQTGVIHASVVYTLDTDLKGEIRSSECEENFFDAVRQSEACKAVQGLQIQDIRTGSRTY